MGENYETILVEKKEGGVAIVTLNLPESLNPLEVRLERELVRALKDCARDDEVRAVVLTGAGKAFSAGGDIKKMEQGVDLFQGKDWVEDGGNVSESVANLCKPVIAAVNGPAVGGGVNLALMCDYVIASEKAYFSEIFTQVGLIPDAGGHWILPRLVGYRKAMELILTAEKVDAMKALELGLINRVVPADKLLEEAVAFAGRLAKGPTKAFGLTKTILRKSFSSDLGQILELEQLAQGLAFQSDDHREGVRAFREKRPPEFKGK